MANVVLLHSRITREFFTVGPEGGRRDVPRASAHFIFPPGAVTEPTQVTWCMWDPALRGPAGDRGEMLVSNVIELKFPGQVTVVLPYSSTDLGGYEVVVKQLTEDSLWEEVDTLDITDESGKLLVCLRIDMSSVNDDGLKIEL